MGSRAGLSGAGAADFAMAADDLAQLDRATRSLAAAAVELQNIYFGAAGLIAGFRAAGEEAAGQTQAAVELALALQSSAESIDQNIAALEGIPGSEAQESAARWADELARADAEMDRLEEQAGDLPRQLPRIEGGYQAIAQAIGSAEQAQSALNAALDTGIDLQATELANAVIAAGIKQGSAKSAALTVVRAKLMEAMAGYIASVFASVPFPLNLALAGSAEVVVGKAVDAALAGVSRMRLPSFAQGGEFVTSGPQLILVGDNPSGRERVQVTPVNQQAFNSQQNITVNIQAPLVDEAVIDIIGPAIVRARELGKVGILVSSVDAH